MKYNRILILGSPGSGKGTQAKFISEKFNYQHLSSGDILRKTASEDNEYGIKISSIIKSGQLVPDELINEMFLKYFINLASQKIISDGYPRKLSQAIFLEQNNFLFDVVIYLNVSLTDVIDRISGRLTAKISGETYHVKYKPPKLEGFCDVSGEKLFVREDDRPETVKKRYALYLKETQPLIDYYNKKSLVIEIDAEKSIAEVQEEIIKRVFC
jgi:adenylate kinase